MRRVADLAPQAVELSFQFANDLGLSRVVVDVVGGVWVLLNVIEVPPCAGGRCPSLSENISSVEEDQLIVAGPHLVQPVAVIHRSTPVVGACPARAALALRPCIWLESDGPS